MSSDKPSSAGQPKRIARRLRVIGLSALVVGLVAAGLIYWWGTRKADLSNDLSMQGFNRAEQRQMGRLYGKSGLLIDDLEADLKQPATQATLVVIVAALVAGGCFYFARLTDDSRTP